MDYDTHREQLLPVPWLRLAFIVLFSLGYLALA